MSTENTSTKRRRPGRKAEDIHTVWTELAPEAVFAGKTPADLEAAMTAYEQAQEPLRKLNLERSAAVKTRDEKLAELRHLLAVIVRGVQGHADYGEDCSLYRAMGFVPKSERASGLTRKEKDDPAAAGQDETAACSLLAEIEIRTAVCKTGHRSASAGGLFCRPRKTHKHPPCKF